MDSSSRPHRGPVVPSSGVRCRGYFDRVHWGDGILSLAGWVLALGHPVERLVVRHDGRPLGEAARHAFDGVASLYPDEPDAHLPGFAFDAFLPALDAGRFSTIDVNPVVAGVEAAGLSILHRPNAWGDLPLPPPPLRIRVTGHGSETYYRLTALQTFSDFHRPIAALGLLAKGGGGARRVLDWGSGAGRVTGLFLRHWPDAEVVGCDIDEEAVAWCAAHLDPGGFVAIPRDPPTRFDAASFDLIVSHSVFTHLTRDRQDAWLAEMARVLAPGGHFLATVSGDFAALPPCPQAVRAELARDGISDGTLDAALDEVAPRGYYRTVYQTEAYTRRTFGRHFEIVDYVSQAISRYQDLVIMRKR